MLPTHPRLPIFHLEFPTQYLAASTFLRFQEYSESPVFGDTSFSLETFMDRFAARNGSFSYYTDWSGSCIHSSVLAPFRQGVLGRLSMKERALLHALPATAHPYSLVASYTGMAREQLAHQIVHGYFRELPAYADAVCSTLALEKDSEGMRDLRTTLQRKEHGTLFFEDEMNACLLTGLPDMPTSSMRLLKKQKQKMHALFDHYFGFNISVHGGDVCLRQSIIPLSYRRFAAAYRSQQELWET